jgi:hypothetical protein
VRKGGYLQVKRLATGWMVRDSIPAGGEVFLTPLHILYNGYRGFFSGLKRPGRCVFHQSPSSAEVKGSA